MPVPVRDPEAAWTRVRAALRDAVTESTFQLWVEPLRLEGQEGDVLLVGAPDGIRNWVADRFVRVLEASAQSALGPEVTVSIVPLEGGDADAPAGRGTAAEPDRRAPAVLAETFNPKYTFEQFVIGDSNRLAHAAALAVAELPGQAYNPLFIYGPPGLGKTHLLHAIANYLAVHEPGATVRYTTAEAFTNHFIHAIHNSGADRFKALYRDTDVLLVDDVQFLERKAKTEEELFHTFNALYDTGAQLVLTSDRRPHDLEAVEDRLRERFNCGLVTDVTPPDHALRMTLLRKRAAHDGVRLDGDEALEVIARRLEGSVRDLEAALIRVVAFHSLTRRPIDAGLAAQVLEGLYPGLRPAPRSTDQILDAVAEAFGVTREELDSKSRLARVSWPRQVAMYLCRELTDESLPAIGRRLGGRNHTTVLHAWRRTTARLAADPDARAAVEAVSRRLGGRVRSA